MSENTTQTTPVEEDKCKPPKASDPPKLPPDDPFKQKCCCPKPPGGDGASCLTDMIAEQSGLAEQAALAKEFADELRGLQDKAVAARTKYTQAAYDKMVAQWQAQDGQIKTLTERVACNVKCWKCLLECRLCPLLHEIRTLERQLVGTGTFATSVDTLQELAQWHERNRAERQAYFDRVQAVLKAWEDPATTLQEALDANKALLGDPPPQGGSQGQGGAQPQPGEIDTLFAADPAGAIFKLFVVAIPRHLAIAPRGAGAPTSNIDDKFLKVCCGDDDAGDDCCGPETGLRSVRKRLLPVLPYLLPPDDLFELICCLVSKRLVPAKELLAKAVADHENAKRNVDTTKARIKERTEALEAAFKAEIGTSIDCSKYWKKSGPDDPCTQPSKPTEPCEPDEEKGHA